MKELKFKQPIWKDGKIIQWHYWGFKDGLYQHPINQHESYQYTGRKDKNGKEIYEGDIVSCMAHDTANWASDDNQKEFVSHVEWEYDMWYVGLGNYHYMNPVGQLDSRSSKKIEIVGNIYENPQILEEPESDTHI